MSKVSPRNLILIILSIIFVSLIISANNLYLVNNTSELAQKLKRRVLGYEATSIHHVNDFKKYFRIAIQTYSSQPEYKTIDVKIDQQDIFEIWGSKKEGINVYVPAGIDVYDSLSTRSLEGKVRLKGDRKIHHASINEHSLRVNLKGSGRLFGLEEFSIQHPVIRGYTWELLTASIFAREGLLTLKTEPAFLSVNGDPRGLYFIEEVPNSRTLERQGRKAGPIFGLDEDFGPSIRSPLDVYDQKEWENNNLFTFSQSLLRSEFDRALTGLAFSSAAFDIDEWAKYFALSDLFQTYHGTVPKSVKFYFNPVIGAFQPILFDAHRGATEFDNFILADFQHNTKFTNCGWICPDAPFYSGFMKNDEFYSAYLNYLEKYSDQEFVKQVREIYNDDLIKIDGKFYRSFAKNDAINSKGLGLYFLRDEILIDRAFYLESRIKGLRRNLTVAEDRNGQLAGIRSNEFAVHTSVNVIEYKDLDLIGGELTFKEPTILVLRGDSRLYGVSEESPLKIRGPMMFVQLGGSIDLKDVLFEGLEAHAIINRNWSGAANLIGTSAKIENLIIRDTYAEDAINFVDTSFEAGSIQIINARSDAIDFDFSEGTISTVVCKSVGNDCLDGSESTVLIDDTIIIDVGDKAVSAGENTIMSINSVKLDRVAIGFVSKDGSTLEVKSADLNNVDLAIAAFNKKPEYNEPKISITSVKSPDPLVAFVTTQSVIKLPNTVLLNEMSSDEIEGSMYGNTYGRKTEK